MQEYAKILMRTQVLPHEGTAVNIMNSYIEQVEAIELETQRFKKLNEDGPVRKSVSQLTHGNDKKKKIIKRQSLAVFPNLIWP
jgi:hypothetical protein